MADTHKVRAIARRALLQGLVLSVETLLFVLAVGVHLLLGKLADIVLGSEFTAMKQIAHGVFAVAFLLVYLSITYRMVLIFIPELRIGKESLNSEGPGSVLQVEED